ncbi:MAG: hypothetical protein D6741_17915 [Planctomycetota bacterium]|nr:MAG: hypothetical protein D6741_17915 [Planctomycetota bacterium]
MLTDQEVLKHYYLDVRCMLLEIAATLDRYDCGRTGSESSAAVPPELEKIYRSLEILADRTVRDDRAETLLRLFSDPIDEG